MLAMRRTDLPSARLCDATRQSASASCTEKMALDENPDGPFMFLSRAMRHAPWLAIRQTLHNLLQSSASCRHDGKTAFPKRFRP
jgi:hypothetical protein